MVGRPRLLVARASATWLIGAALAIAPWSQRIGQVVVDTRIELALGPGSFLARSTEAWDRANLGGIPNQRVGYLFPMGPFFAAGRALGLSAPSTQRLWASVLLLTGFVGVVRLARRLGIMHPALAGLAYALSPWVVASLSTTAAVLPAMILPWTLLPLFSPTPSIRSVARSAASVLLMGGVNAVGVASVLVMPIGLLVARRRWRDLLTWSTLVTGITCWWWIPLLLQQRFGYDFTAFTETAASTTHSMDPLSIVRGSHHWLNTISRDGAAWLPGGSQLRSEPAAIVWTGVAAALGLGGLCHPSMPSGRLLRGTAIGATAAMAMAYAGRSGGPMAALVERFLDGPGVALRNISKLDPLLRLPLALGLAFATSHLRQSRGHTRATTALCLAGYGVVAACGVLPFTTGKVYPDGSFTELPDAWSDAITWVDGLPADEQVLVFPSAAFAEFSWGRPIDEPLILARGVSAARTIAPLGPIGLTRIIDEFEQRLQQPPPAGAELLLRSMGVRYVLVRHDLLRERDDTAALRWRLLTEGAILRDVFGTSAQIEVFEFPDISTARLIPLDAVSVLVGGPDGIAAARAAGIADPLVLANDPGSQNFEDRQRIVSDAMRLRRESFNDVGTGGGPTMSWAAFGPFRASALRIEPRWISALSVLGSDATNPAIELPTIPTGTSSIIVDARSDDDLDRVVTMTEPTIMAVETRSEQLRIDGTSVANGDLQSFSAGRHRISGGSVHLVREGRQTPPASAPVQLINHSATSNELRTTSHGDAIIMTGHSYNAGWAATSNGRRLTPVRIDGWQQAYVAPAAAEMIQERYEPAATYRRSILLGALFIIIVTGLACRSGRPRPSPIRPASISSSRLATRVAAAAFVWLAFGWFVCLIPLLYRLPERRWTLPRLAAGCVSIAALGAALDGGGRNSLLDVFSSTLAVVAFVSLAVAWMADEPVRREGAIETNSGVGTQVQWSDTPS